MWLLWRMAAHLGRQPFVLRPKCHVTQHQDTGRSRRVGKAVCEEARKRPNPSRSVKGRGGGEVVERWWRRVWR